MTKRKIVKTCYTFTKTIHDWKEVYNFWDKIAFDTKQYNKYKAYLLKTTEFVKIHPSVDLKKHKTCWCK